MPISVVIPALDEEAQVSAAIGSVRAGAGEILVVDGGSRDRTREVAARAGARVLDSPRGRGLQLDRGARAATGKWLVFLHADTRLEEGWAEALGGVPSHASGGAFRFAVDAPGRSFRLLEAAVAFRSSRLHLPYGDQALFTRRDTYEAMGGFAPLPLMEDVDFVRRLRRQGPLALLRPRAFTSARRWRRHGLLGASLRNLGLLALYLGGVSPARLARLYR